MFKNNNVGRKCENNISCIKCLDFDKYIISKVKTTFSLAFFIKEINTNSINCNELLLRSPDMSQRTCKLILHAYIIFIHIIIKLAAFNSSKEKYKYLATFHLHVCKTTAREFDLKCWYKARRVAEPGFYELYK